MRFIQIIFTLSICASAILGDYIVFNTKYSSSQIFRAFADSSVHGIIGLFSSLLFFSYGMNITTEAWIYNVLFCSAMSSFIDIDHFIVAKSFNLKDINIDRRGIFHNTSFCIVMTSILLIASYLTRKMNVFLLTYMLIIAFTSHHLRDGNRRGIWFYPYGQTRPLGSFIYMCLICVLPSILASTYNYMRPIKHNVPQRNI